MKNQPIRVGIIGAGSNTRLKHIPLLQKLPDVVITSVCNRTYSSGEKVAREFSIPKVCHSWTEVIEDKSIDAVVIGTWPYLHKTLTCAALEANKHVLCEARMALDATEAWAMLEAARRKPDLVAQLVPAPFTFTWDQTIIDLIREGYLGDMLVVSLRQNGTDFIDTTAPMSWRQSIEYSGVNTLFLGIWYETLARWIGHARSVTAMIHTFVPRRLDPETNLFTGIMVPDHVDLIADFACGAQVSMQFSTVTGCAPAHSEIRLHGSAGTLVLDVVQQKLFGTTRRDNSLKEITISEDKKMFWRVEESFINAIRHKETVTLTRFEEGVRYMEFTEAVIRSGQTGRHIHLPLRRS